MILPIGKPANRQADCGLSRLAASAPCRTLGRGLLLLPQSALRAGTARGPIALAKRARQGFTLIELILIMTLLVIVISIVTPRMNGFFAGRSLDSEVRQFVATTHYAQSRAISEGVPMFLWVDPKAGTYGLSQETGYTDHDTKADTFKVADGLKIDIGRASLKSNGKEKRVGIHFSPDGNTVTNTSVAGVSFKEGVNPPVWVMPSANGLMYEVQTDKNKIASIRR